MSDVKVVKGSTTKKKDAAPKSSKVKKKKTDEKGINGENTTKQESNVDFEAGIMFSKLDKNGQGVISADDFQKMWREVQEKQSVSVTLVKQSDSTPNAIQSNPNLSFEAGKLFSRFDRDGDGKLNKKEFEDVMCSFPGMAIHASSSGSAVLLPTEVVTGRLLTHYDETAGVAIPSSSVEHHRSMGNTVVPLVESYKMRYDKLRSLLTGRLLPRREHILQLRRQLENCSTDVSAARRAIEKETTTDAEQIIEQLRSTESMRQSAIKQQILQLEVELESIERTVRRVEIANEQSSNIDGTTGITLTSVSSAIPGTLSAVESVKGHKAASMVELIQQFTDISSTIERLSTKALMIQVDFPTTDFPRETADRLYKISHFDKCIQAVQVKDQMLWSVVKEKEEREDLIRHEKSLCDKYAVELKDWTELAQGLLQQLDLEKQNSSRLAKRNQELIQVLRDHNIMYVIDDDYADDTR